MTAAYPEAEFGWIWSDDEGWEHNPLPWHPHERGEAQYGMHFRPATEAEARSPDFLRCPEVHIDLFTGEQTITGAGGEPAA